MITSYKSAYSIIVPLEYALRKERERDQSHHQEVCNFAIISG